MKLPVAGTGLRQTPDLHAFGSAAVFMQTSGSSYSSAECNLADINKYPAERYPYFLCIARTQHHNPVPPPRSRPERELL